MSASQDYRDGAANGAGIMEHRLIRLSVWGVTLTDRIIRELAAGVQAEYGGTRFPDTWGVK